MLESCLSELTYIKETLDNKTTPRFFDREFSFFSHEPALLYLAGADQVVYLNQCFTRQLGYAHRDIEKWGYSIKNLFCDDGAISFFAALKKIKEGELSVSDHCLVNGDGEKITCRLYCMLLYKECYSIRIEKQDTRLQDSAKKELEEFAYIASHDLQEPLRKITTFIQRLEYKLGEVNDEDISLYIKRINISAGNMRNLIDALLEYSRVERNREDVSPVDLLALTTALLKDLEPVIQQTDASVNVGSLPVVEAKYSQVQQLFHHVLDNAIKFRKPDIPPVINITSRDLTKEEKKQYQLSDAYEYALMTVSDNGIGFEAEYADRIFQLFQRLHGKHEYPGTGLGLGICKKIAAHNKGYMFAGSVPGEGSSFYIILPKPFSSNV